MDDCFSGVDSVEEATTLQWQLHNLFLKARFLLHKRNFNISAVLKYVPDKYKDPLSSHVIPDSEGYTRTLGIEWNAELDHFRPQLKEVTKRFLVSDIAKVYDVLGLFSPTTIKMKILLQKLWDRKTDCDEIPSDIFEMWLRWRNQLVCLSNKFIPRCYSSSDFSVASTELHEFCDASESAYAAVVYLRPTDSSGHIQISLVASKTKVAPLKQSSIPRLELCGTLLAQLLHYLSQVFVFNACLDW